MEHSKDLKAVTFYTQRNSFEGKEEEEKKSCEAHHFSCDWMCVSRWYVTIEKLREGERGKDVWQKAAFYYVYIIQITKIN